MKDSRDGLHGDSTHYHQRLFLCKHSLCIPSWIHFYQEHFHYTSSQSSPSFSHYSVAHLPCYYESRLGYKILKERKKKKNVSRYYEGFRMLLHVIIRQNQFNVSFSFINQTLKAIRHKIIHVYLPRCRITSLESFVCLHLGFPASVMKKANVIHVRTSAKCDSFPH